jgi:hypothetical protein
MSTWPGLLTHQRHALPQGSGYNYLFEATTTCAAIGITNSFPFA